MTDVKGFAQKAGYIQTVSGNRVHIPNTDPSSITIFDIAWALSKAARFCGHLDQPLSVAEHSVNVSNHAYDLALDHGLTEKEANEIALQGLLHDATEAYLCDIPTPFKVMIPGYAEMEDQLWAVIANKYGVPVKMHAFVKEADRVMLMSERDQYRSVTDDWGDLELVTRKQLNPVVMTAPNAFETFCNLFQVLNSAIPR